MKRIQICALLASDYSFGIVCVCVATGAILFYCKLLLQIEYVMFPITVQDSQDMLIPHSDEGNSVQ